VTVVSHVYPYAQQQALKGLLNLSSTTTGAFRMGLCTGSAATWGATQQAYQFVSAVTAAYTEVTSSGYARVSLTGITLTQNTDANVWTCTSPVSFGSAITLSAASAFVYTTLTGSADSSYPVIAIIDFGQTVASTAGPWTYTVDPVNGLAFFTES
jgi:hypothetical protein